MPLAEGCGGVETPKERRDTGDGLKGDARRKEDGEGGGDETRREHI
jgi:hypothetical protein